MSITAYERTKEWRKKNAEKHAALQRSYYLKNKDKIAKYQRNYYKAKRNEGKKYTDLVGSDVE